LASTKEQVPIRHREVLADPGVQLSLQDPLAKRMLAWANERFPPPNAILIAFLYATALIYGRALTNGGGALSFTWGDLLAYPGVLAYSLLVRIFDEHKDYEKAYAIWNADPDWKQHPQKYAGYNFGTFELDWGPTGEYGEIRSHTIRTSITPKNSSGVVVISMINDRKVPLALWVEKKDKSITFLPPTLNIRIEP